MGATRSGTCRVGRFRGAARVIGGRDRDGPMRFDIVPKPPAVAARPRDERGYPVPAITPWEEGRPQFALTDHERSAACARERLCSVCNTRMPRGPVWRVVGGAEAVAIGEALA